MADIVNLRQARKQKARDAARSRGTEAAAKTGRSKALKALEKARAEMAEHKLEGHKIDSPKPA